MTLFPSNANPKVSIIMPAYNRAEYIGETIASVRNQTYTNWELIIMDDGSDDNTEEIISALKDERIRYFKVSHIGMQDALRNIGIRNASGELIAFLDSDDLWAATKIEKQVAAFAQYPEAGFSLTNGYNFKVPGEVLAYFYEKREGLRYDNILISFFRSEASAITSALLIRKECMRAGNAFDESKTLSHIYFLLDLASRFKAVILYEPLFYRRLHDANYSGINWVKRHYEGIEMLKSYQKALPRKVARETLFNSYINFGEQWLQRKKSGKAMAQFLRAWWSKPLSIVPLKKSAKAMLYFFRK